MNNIKNKLKIIWRISNSFLYFFVIFILIAIGGIIAITALHLPSGLRLFVVKSGSMNPAIPVGSVVVVKPQPNYYPKDIITFKRKEDVNIYNPSLTTTHRIFQSIKKDNSDYYVTKGDANIAPDGNAVSKVLVIGKVLFYIPFLGYPVSFAQKPFGFIMLVVIPATIIIYSELINIKNEVVKIIGKKKSEKTNS